MSLMLISRHVDFEELRQILRQAQHFDVVQQVRHDAALSLHARRARGTLEVQRNAHADVLVLQHALQIHVQDLVLGGMTLHILEDRSLLLAVDAQRQDRRIEAFIDQQRQQILVIQKYLTRRR